MHVTDRVALIKQNSLAPDYTETSIPFHDGSGKGEGAIADEVHRIIALAFVCLGAWLKPLFSRAGRESLSTIHEYDPYVVGLMRYLQGQRRN